MGAEPHDSSPSLQRYLLLFLLLLLVNLFAVAFFRGGRLRDTHIYMRTYIYVWVGEHATVSFHRECLRYIYIYTYICICVCVGGKGGRNTQLRAFMGGVCVIYMSHVHIHLCVCVGGEGGGGCCESRVTRLHNGHVAHEGV